LGYAEELAVGDGVVDFSDVHGGKCPIFGPN